ncbi:hypothetical protein C491_00607 [Natronococcus amylolyticus DSM 10524]|uniref:DUF7981 domain-containing protein n=1 Tax=Natronococcus amylolyticus DSM 10524 TaxID=1227497 RepID=L9XKY7_9EURY|nr:hypothetical protein [Natronococcus amylolyticus]ELY61313.1 hypothetical protein C491_00607 [Natronococcus amylolyticus DSM 10524]
MMGSSTNGFFGLSRRAKSALLWGLVGALSFLVLVQGYALFVERLVTMAQGALVAVLVGIGAGIGSYLLEHRIVAWTTRRTE